jgi:hypothetical protein
MRIRAIALYIMYYNVPCGTTLYPFQLLFFKNSGTKVQIIAELQSFFNKSSFRLALYTYTVETRQVQSERIVTVFARLYQYPQNRRLRGSINPTFVKKNNYKTIMPIFDRFFVYLCNLFFT